MWAKVLTKVLTKVSTKVSNPLTSGLCVSGSVEMAVCLFPVEETR